MKEIDPAQLTLDLVGLPSVNPDLGPGDGELPLMDRVGDLLADLGLDVEIQPVDGARGNVLATLEGTAPGRLVFEAHLDTVPLPIEPCGPALHNGRVWGRGACDTKASVAAMLAALQRLSAHRGPRPSVMFAGVVDEEFVMRGAQRLVDKVDDVLGIVVGEPTNLYPVRAHNGCVRFDIEVRGVTAHSSKAYLGRSALLDAARLVLALQEQVGEGLRSRPHVLTGAGLLTATEIRGGTAPNVVPDRCVVRFDRRTTPGETVADVCAEVDGVLESMAQDHGIQASRLAPWLELPAVEVSPEDRLVRRVEASSSKILGESTSASGVPYCTDANVLTGLARVPSVVVGPGSIDQAHAPVEWVEVPEIHAATALYEDLVLRMAPDEQEETSA